jgi:uncharacterized protein YbjT (DUF2867 family)
MVKALLFGATGVVGAQILKGLLEDPHFDQVTAVTRKKIGLTHPKLKNLIGDLKSLTSLKAQLGADEVFIALGTTRARTPDLKEYYAIDHDYPVEAARIAKENGATGVHLVSAVGADAHSSIFYVRTKGECERDILALGYARTNIFRPSMLLGERTETRPAEAVFKKIWPLIDVGLIGPLKQYRGISNVDVARAMVATSKADQAGIKYFHWQDMMDLVRV